MSPCDVGKRLNILFLSELSRKTPRSRKCSLCSFRWLAAGVGRHGGRPSRVAISVFYFFRSKRSRSMTFAQAAAKSFRNFSGESAQA